MWHERIAQELTTTTLLINETKLMTTEKGTGAKAPGTEETRMKRKRGNKFINAVPGYQHGRENIRYRTLRMENNWERDGLIWRTLATPLAESRVAPHPLAFV